MTKQQFFLGINMADQIYYSVFTEAGLALLAESIRNGTKLGIDAMAFGDGDGSLPVPNSEFTELVNEVYRTQLNSLAPDPNNANWLRAEAVIASAIGGFNIRELGLYAGDILVAYSNYPPTFKPNPADGTARIMTFRLILQIDNTANFELKIDADIVMATIRTVEEAKQDAKDYADLTKVQNVESVDDLVLLDTWNGRTTLLKSYHLDMNKGGGIFKFDPNLSTINNFGTIINGWVRINTEYVTPEMFGAINDGVFDNTLVYEKMVNAIPENTKVIFEKGIYLGNLYSTKNLDIQINADAVLKPKTGNNEALIMFESSGTQQFILGQIDRGTLAINLPISASVKKGSLITLWNGYLRNNDPNNPVNYETVRVNSVEIVNNENKCTLERPTKSRQLGSTIYVYVTENPLETIKFNCDGLLLNEDVSNWGRLVVFKRCFNAKVNNFHCSGSVAHALSFEESYGGTANFVTCEKPLSTGSGAGYGVVSWKSSGLQIGKVFSNGMRHAVDFSSTYDSYVDYIKESDAQSAAIALSHNGYCGDVGVGVVEAFTRIPTYIVSTSSQGYLPDDQAVRRLSHPIHNIKIGSIYVETSCNVNDNIRVLNLDTEMRGTVDIGKIEIKYSTKAQPSTNSPSALIYVTGQAEFIKIGTLKANCIRHPCFMYTSSGNERTSRAIIDLIDIGVSDFGIYTGGYNLEVKEFHFENIARGYLCEVITSGGTNIYTQAKHLSIEKFKMLNGANYPQPISVSAGITLQSGNLGKSDDVISTSVNVDDNTALSAKDLQLKAGCFILSPPAFESKSNITLAALPNPTYYNGQRVKILNSRLDLAKRSTVTIPKGLSSYNDIILEHSKSVELVSMGGKWLAI